MFKRANKITSLLVAAAAVASMVPAYAADVKKIESQDGKVYNAVAYKDGEAYVDGEVNDKDEAAYYVANGKYNSLSDIDAGSDITTYGTKYVNVEGGDYFVDLTNGKVTDDSVQDDATDDAASNLRKKVKGDTDGRYLKDGSSNAADTLKTTLTAINGSKFADVWYTAQFSNKDATNGLNANGGGLLTVFTDGAGSYIDADYNVGKIKVTTTASGSSGTVTKSEYIENTDDTYDTADSNAKVKASVVGVAVLGQDKDYIYRKATVTVTTTSSAATITEIDGKPVTVTAAGKTSPFTAVANGYQFDAIQKISKAQSSDDIGGVKYAKSVSTYVIADSDGYKEVFNYGNYAIASGKVIGYTASAASSSDNVTVQTATLKSEDGLYYVDLGSSSTDDTVVYSNTKVAVDVDSDGNLWRLDSGYVYEWNNDEDWDKVYKVDGSFDEFSVYDKNNIVAWNQDDEVYSVIGGKTTTKAGDDATTTTTTTTTTAAAGWVKNTDGTWSYNKAGVKATGWVQDGAWYYLNANGIMQTGWQNVGGTWYFLNASGAMQTGWINDGGTWYYCNASGAMLANTVVDGYVLGASGAWVK